VPVGCAHYERIYDNLVDAIEHGADKCVKDEEVIRVLEILEEATEVAKSHSGK
jgi:predicted dehydrogenase